MDNLGDLLYLLFVIGAVVLSFLKKKYQAQQPQKPTPAHEAGEEELEWPEELRRIFGHPESASPPKPGFAQSVSSPLVREFAKPATGLHTTLANRTKSNVVEVDEIDEKFVLSDADWPKAVIYSEILKRPAWD